jgi:hypothetical protein
MIIPNFELFDKSIQDLEVCLDIFKYFKNNGADKNMQLWSDQIHEKIGIINRDDFYNHQYFSPVSMPDQSSKKALELFTDDDVAFQELLHTSLLVQGKIKPDNIKHLKSLLTDNPINKNLPTDNHKEYAVIIDDVLDDVHQKKDLHKWITFYETIKKDFFSLNHDIIKSLWVFILDKINTKKLLLANSLYGHLRDELNKMKIHCRKVQNYELEMTVRDLMDLTVKFKVRYDYHNAKPLSEVLFAYSIDEFLHLIQLDCVMAANLISEMAKAKVGIPLVAEIKKYFKGFDCFYLFKQLGNVDHVCLFVFELSALYKDDNDCKYGYKAMCHLYGGRLSAAIKSFDKIENKSQKITFLEKSFTTFMQLRLSEFLINYIDLWSCNEDLIKKYLKVALKEIEVYNLNRLYETADKNLYFILILQFYFEKGDWCSIRNLNIEYPEDTAKINALFDEQYPFYLSKHLENVLLTGESHLIIRFFKEHRNADIFEKTLLKVLKYNANQFEATDQVLDDSVLDCFLYAYPTNFELVKLLLFEKIKKEIMLDKNSMLLNKARRNMEIDILLDVYKK